MLTGLSPHISNDINAALTLWEPDSFVSGLPQSTTFVRNWQAHVNADCFIAALYDGGRPILMLPLEVVKSRLGRLARFPGGTHANGNFPILARAYADGIGVDDIRALMRAIHAARPDIDGLLLTRQLGSLNGMANPLHHLKTALNPNPVLSASLSSGFDAVLERSNAKRKRKKHRQHTRRYEDAGGYRIVTADTSEEAQALLNRFFVIKAERFAKGGIDNVFSEPGVRDFFHALFGESTGRTPRTFEAKGLEVGGIIRAVIGKSYWVGDLTVEFGGIADDDLVSASPGEYLFFEDIAQSCVDGVSVYSFGIGDEPYKRDWCDIEQPLYDSVIGFTVKGGTYAAVYRARNAIAMAVKRNAWAWRLAKKLRARVS
ncbi:GNAT family N-acetyltransferase [Phyllobacterium leguminum]|uniref:CelD/BcsL family acetyltransferase involved in cellulose biosynthesis n=1 Tax=Phyllobacterium leguminum TaxID=314237 RepID=A0A318TF98_9HYPH|nr:GNAT family N-acetyltransferase [Phyllobacterium leguminum]PYE87157.1 CelD/BcsL family acetyltransferase involved in cellulose biosynthesis [Phyllobacterium leguminum]